MPFQYGNPKCKAAESGVSLMKRVAVSSVLPAQPTPALRVFGTHKDLGHVNTLGISMSRVMW